MKLCSVEQGSFSLDFLDYLINGAETTGRGALKETEQSIHLRLVELLRRSPNHNVVWWHTPNQGNFPVQYRTKLRRMGVKPGVADLLFTRPSECGPQLFSLELKTEVGRATPEQVDWRDYIRDIGGFAEIAHGWDHAIRTLGAWEIIKVREA